jgi:hypothetical protein
MKYFIHTHDQNESTMRLQTLSLNPGEILIADSGVEDLASLLEGMNPGVQAWLVQPGDDAISLIAKALASPGLRALHLLAHGSPGAIHMGGRVLKAADFRSRFDGGAQRDLDIAFWSCHTGADDAGQDFVAAVADATGARVASSRGLVGNAELGGSWKLNTSLTAPFSDYALTNFQEVLAYPAYTVSGSIYTVTDTSVNASDLASLSTLAGGAL